MKEGELYDQEVGEKLVLRIAHGNAQLRTHVPCRYSGIRPKYDPSIKLDSYDSGLWTEIKTILGLFNSFHT